MNHQRITKVFLVYYSTQTAGERDGNGMKKGWERLICRWNNGMRKGCDGGTLRGLCGN